MADDKTMIADQLIAAERAMHRGNWNDARALYRAVLDTEPKHPKALQGLQEIDNKIQTEANIRDMIQKGDEHMARQEYEAAFNSYNQAFNHAGQAGLPQLKPAIEEKRAHARDLTALYKNVQDTLQTVRGLEKQKQFDEALKILDERYQTLPQGALYQPLIDEIEAHREKIIAAMGTDARFVEARKAFENHDYERVLELLLPLHPSTPHQAKNMVEDAQYALNKDIYPTLKRVEAAQTAALWADAFAELTSLKERYPKSPVWRRHWLQVGMAHGQRALADGRTENVNRNFAQAQGQFRAAKDAFQKVLDVYPQHETAPTLKAEADDLLQIAVAESQAETDWRAGKRAEARSALEGAHRRIAHAREEGRSYDFVENTVQSMHQTIQAELDRIAADQQRLADAERLLENKHLQEARDNFYATLDALLQDHKIKAKDGLDRVEAEMRRFQTEMSRATNADAPETALQALEKAYACWPAGEGMPLQLIRTLLQAAETAFHEGRGADTVTHCQRVLELDPYNKQATDWQAKVGIQEQIKGTLQKVRQSLDVLDQQPNCRAADFQPSLDHLADILRQTTAYPELGREAEALRRRVTERQQHWRAFEEGYAQAEMFRKAGDWAQAAEEYRQALTELGDETPESVRIEQRTWAQIASAAQIAEEQATELYHQAEAAYKQAPETGDFDPALTALQTAEDTLAQVQRQAQEARGGLPASSRRLDNQVRDLKNRASLAQEAMQQTPGQGLKTIKNKKGQDWTDDPTLQAVESEIRKRATEDVQLILLQADQALEIGNLTEAVDLITEANALQPENPEVRHRYTDLKRRQKLEDRLLQVQTDYATKMSTGSLPDAGRALRKGLEIFREPEYGLPEEFRNTLHTLMSLDSELAFGTDETWAEAQEILKDLGNLTHVHPLASQAYSLALDWSDIARDVALRGVVRSAEQLGNLIEGYRGAIKLRERNPGDANAILEEAKMLETMLTQANSSADRRLVRAREALTHENYMVALENLEELEGAVYGSIEAAFPNLLERYDEVDALRAQARQLQREAEELKAVYDRVHPLLEAVEKAYLEGRFADAKEIMEKIPVLKANMQLARQVEEWRGRLGEKYKEAQHKDLCDTLTQARTAMRLAAIPTEMVAVLETLKAVRERVDLHTLSHEDREAYYALVDEANAQKENLSAGESWSAQAQTFMGEKKYSQAYEAFEKALQTTRDGKQRVAVETQMTEIKTLAEEQRTREEAKTRGTRLFYAQQYIQAQQELRLARNLGAEGLNELHQAARAGARLQNAQATAETGNWRAVADDLEEIFRLGTDNRHTDEILEAAQQLKQQMARVVEGETKIQQLLMAARFALAADDLQSANRDLQTLLEINRMHPEALALQEQVIKKERIRQQVQAAQQALEAGDFTKALAQAKGILTLEPGYPAAVTIQEDAEAKLAGIKAREKGQALLQQARNHASNEDFEQARTTLQQAVNAGVSSQELEDARMFIEREEQKWENKIIAPIDNLRSIERYSKAFDLCRQALENPLSPALSSRIRELQRDIANRWAEKDLREQRSLLDQADEKTDFLTILTVLKQLDALDPAPDAHLVEIERLVREVRQQQLQTRLDTIQRRAEQEENWEESVRALAGLRDEADTHELWRISIQANKLRVDLEGRIFDRDAVVQTTARQDLLVQAEVIFDGATTLVQLQHAQTLLAASPFLGDPDVASLHEKITTEIEAYQRTQQAIKDSADKIRQQDFRAARSTLSLTQVSRLLEDEYDRQKQVTGGLERAWRAESREAWETALDEYQAVLDIAPELLAMLEMPVEKCRNHQVRLVIESATEALEKDEIAVAEKQLETARTRAWITPGYQVKVDDLQAWIDSNKAVVHADELLQQVGTDTTQVEILLGQAGHAQSRGRVRQLQGLLQAIKAWGAGDYETTTDALTRLQPPVSQSVRVKQLQEAVVRASQVARNLREARQQATASMRAIPPEHATAVQITRQALEQTEAAGHDYVTWGKEAAVFEALRAEAGRLQTTIAAELRTQLENAKTALQYAHALEYGDALRKLLPKDSETQNIQTALSQEREQQFHQRLETARTAFANGQPADAERALRQAAAIMEPEGDARLDAFRAEWQGKRLQLFLNEVDAHLQTYQLEEAENALQLAEKLIAPATDSRVTALRHKLTDRRTTRQATEKLLAETREALNTRNWQQAATALSETRGLALAFAEVSKMTILFHAQILEQAQVYEQTQAFVKALELCQIALSVAQHDEVTRLQARVETTRSRLVAELQPTIQQALEIWDLPTAETALNRARAWFVDGRPPEVLFLQGEHHQAMSQQASKVELLMPKGWNQLWARDYRTSLKTFEQVELEAPEFRHEAQRWQSYAKQLQQAHEIIADQSQDRWDDFPLAAQALADAAGEMWINPTHLPLVPSGLQASRRRALWDVQRLQQAAAELVEASSKYLDLEKLGQYKQMVTLVANIEQKQASFLQLVAISTPPPADFSGERETTSRRTQSQSHPTPREARPASEPAPSTPPIGDKYNAGTKSTEAPPPPTGDERKTPPPAGEPASADIPANKWEEPSYETPLRPVEKPAYRAAPSSSDGPPPQTETPKEEKRQEEPAPEQTSHSSPETERVTGTRLPTQRSEPPTEPGRESDHSSETAQTPAQPMKETSSAPPNKRATADTWATQKPEVTPPTENEPTKTEGKEEEILEVWAEADDDWLLLDHTDDKS